MVRTWSAILLATGLAACLRLSAPARETAEIVRVTDGDSFEVQLRGTRERVRLIGIDAPEASQNTKAYRDAERSLRDIEVIVSEGKKATEFLRGLVRTGDVVTLEFDAQERDKYGRILAYMYLPDGRMVNELLLEAGHARLSTFPPNVKHLDRLREAWSRGEKREGG